MMTVILKTLLGQIQGLSGNPHSTTSRTYFLCFCTSLLHFKVPWISRLIRKLYMASPSNDSTVPVSEFLLICFPNFQSWQHLLSLPLSLLSSWPWGPTPTPPSPSTWRPLCTCPCTTCPASSPCWTSCSASPSSPSPGHLLV